MIQLSDQIIYTVSAYCPANSKVWRVDVLTAKPARELEKFPNDILTEDDLTGHGACLVDHRAYVLNSVPMETVRVHA